MNNIRVGHFLGDAGLVYLPLGFIPDYFRLCDIDSVTGNAAVCMHEWFERMQDDELADSKEGWALGLGTLGYTTLHADTEGITAYDTGAQRPPVAVWRASQTALLNKVSGASITVVARSATAPGTFVVGTTSGVNDLGQTVDRDAIFECVTAGTTAAAEPAWPTAVGGQVTDNTTVWERVNEPTRRGGYQGVCISATIQTNTHEYYYLALKADASVDHGDVDGWPDGIDPDWK